MRERKPLTMDATKDKPVTGNVDDARSVRPKTQIDPKRIEQAALDHGFATDGGGRRRRRSVHTDTIAVKVRPGMRDLIEDMCYFRRLKKQELFEAMVHAWLQTEDMPELRDKYHTIIRQADPE